MFSTDFILRHAWLIPALPLFSFLCVGLFIRVIPEKLAAAGVTFNVFVSALLACGLACEYFSLPVRGVSLIPWSFEWLTYQQNLSVQMGVLIDPISVLLLVVVTIVSACVHLYSIEYMKGEKGYRRYFAFLNLFTFSMLGLVLAPNLLQMYVFWELVGVSSFLLIGFYYDRPAAVAASKKAFIVTRFADLGFFIGVLILGYYGYQFYQEISLGLPFKIQPFDFLYLSQPAVLEKFSELPIAFLGVPLFTLAMILIYMGAAGKSAMFPLHIWLPDAMEGPTPVSAFIHAATMVVAGVYLVARMFPVFAAADALPAVAYVGAFTCLFAAVIACTQDDIKRVLAFSTLSQLGYMMFALGIATLKNPAGYTASMFHLFTHAFFKALLFLGAGAVIHAVHRNEIWSMGGLARRMKKTHITFLIATLAISGIWPFAGFFSKDEILLAAFSSESYGIFIVGLLVAGLTAFYMFRIYFVTFWGSPRSAEASHAHEPSWKMLLPLGVLALFSIVAGFVPVEHYITLTPSVSPPEEKGGFVPLISSLVAVSGIALSWFFYTGNQERVKKISHKLGWLYLAIKHKFYFDEIYLVITRQVIFRRIAFPIAWFDRNAVDGGVNMSGWLTQRASVVLSRLQSGQMQTYGTWFVGGVFGIFLIIWWILK